jgi:hypothetical protein
LLNGLMQNPWLPIGEPPSPSPSPSPWDAKEKKMKMKKEKEIRCACLSTDASAAARTVESSERMVAAAAFRDHTLLREIFAAFRDMHPGASHSGRRR